MTNEDIRKQAQKCIEKLIDRKAERLKGVYIPAQERIELAKEIETLSEAWRELGWHDFTTDTDSE